MLPILCFRCSQISTPVEGLRCPHCDGDGSGTVMAENFDSSIPEYGNAGPEYYVTVEDASTQVSEEELEPVEPTRDASTQVSEEELEPVEPTREASTQTSDDDLPLQFAGSHGYENCTESESPSDNLNQLTNENQSSLQVNSNANEAEFHDRSSDICNASTSQEATNRPHVAPQQQRYLGEQSSIGECKNKYGSDEFLKRQGTANLADPVNNVAKLDFTGSVTYEAEDSIMHNLSDSSNNAEGRRERVTTSPSFAEENQLSVNFPKKMFRQQMHWRSKTPKLLTGDQKRYAEVVKDTS